jgi:hypothetical protein
MPELQPLKALYYPHAHFDSVRWLRAALLYWESVLRFVPPGFATLDTPEVHELAAKGLIEDVSPAPYLHEADEVFAARVDELLRTRFAEFQCLNRESGALVHAAEIEPWLLRDLEARGVAASAGDWVAMPPQLATLYKMTLANEAGQALHAAPSTDETGCDIAVMYFARGKLARDPQAVAPIDGFAAASLIHPFPWIEANALPVAKLLDIREQDSKARRAFRARVQASATSIATLPSVEAIRDHLRDLVDEIERDARTERKALRSASRRDFWKTVSVSAPAAIGAAVTLAGAPLLLTVLGVAGSLGMGVTEWFAKHRHALPGASHYLITLGEALGAPLSSACAPEQEDRLGEGSRLRRFRQVPLVSRGDGRLGILGPPVRRQGQRRHRGGRLA